MDTTVGSIKRFYRTKNPYVDDCDNIGSTRAERRSAHVSGSINNHRRNFKIRKIMYDDFTMILTMIFITVL